jgi:hypothetical protein
MAEAVTPEATPVEALKAKAEFQRELYRVADARIGNFDTQVGVIIAATVAVVGFGAGAATRGKVVPELLTASVAAAAVTALLALAARQELPWLWLPVLHRRMREAADNAKTAVGSVHWKKHFTATESAYESIFDAWYALATSIEARRRVKQTLYALAILGLFVELMFVLALLATAESS